MRILLAGLLVLAACGGSDNGEPAIPAPVNFVRVDQTVSSGVAYCDYRTSAGDYAGWCWQNTSTLAGGCYVYSVDSSGRLTSTLASVDAFRNPCYP